jgi:hypothetical protein
MERDPFLWVAPMTMMDVAAYEKTNLQQKLSLQRNVHYKQASFSGIIWKISSSM